MRNNPYSNAKLVLKNGDPITDMRFGNSNMRAIASNGEFNANDKRDLINVITQAMTAIASGEVVPEYKSAISTSSEYAALLQERREILAAAYSDPAKWEALGSSIAAQLEEQRNREGFLRRICVGATLKQGEIARISMPSWDAVAIVATGSASVDYQLVRSKVFTPVEFEIIANLRVESLDIEQVSSDLLDVAYNQGLDSIMVKEDLLWKKAADASVGVVNPLNYIGGSLTTQMLGTMRNAVTDHNLPATNAIISNDYWADVIGSPDFAAMLDPVSKYDLVMNGYLGTLIGMNLITDAFRQPNQKVLNRGEIYVIASSENHAAFTDRGGLRSTPTSGADQGSTTKGWLISEMMAFVLANPRSVSKGKRV